MLQVGFREKQSIRNAPINLSNSIKRILNEFCAIHVDLQKAIDTVHHKFILHRLEYYRIQGACNDWFKSYMSDRKQVVSIKRYNI